MLAYDSCMLAWYLLNTSNRRLPINKPMSIIIYTEITESSVVMEALSQYLDTCESQEDQELALGYMRKIYVGIAALDEVSDE